MIKIKLVRKFQYKLSCNFKIDSDNFIEVSDELEISLPCINCQRAYRTIIFEKINEKGICTPRNKCEGFSGEIINREIIKESDSVKINCLIEFDYQQFIDLKYKTESNFEFGWARVYFTVKCFQCQKETIVSTQENVVRPWDVKCKCGSSVFKDYESPFKYEVIELK